MRRLCSQVVVLLLLVSCAASADDPPMKLFRSAAGRFSIQFPGTPTQSTQQVTLKGGGSAALNLFRDNLQDDYVSYIVTYTDYPDNFNMGAPDSALMQARDGAAAGKKLTSDAAITLMGFPGRAITLVDANGTNLSIHQCLAAKRLYQVIAVAEKGYRAALAEQFMSSFRID